MAASQQYPSFLLDVPYGLLVVAWQSGAAWYGHSMGVCGVDGDCCPTVTLEVAVYLLPPQHIPGACAYRTPLLLPSYSIPLPPWWLVCVDAAPCSAHFASSSAAPYAADAWRTGVFDLSHLQSLTNVATTNSGMFTRLPGDNAHSTTDTL